MLEIHRVQGQRGQSFLTECSQKQGGFSRDFWAERPLTRTPGRLVRADYHPWEVSFFPFRQPMKSIFARYVATQNKSYISQLPLQRGVVNKWVLTSRMEAEGPSDITL